MSITSAIRLFHTVRYLKPTQIHGRLRKKLRRVEPDLSPACSLSKTNGNWTTPALRQQKMLTANSFRFLNETHEIRTEQDWNNVEWSKLWLYNLHYFDDLNAVDAQERIDWHRALIQRWINQNPAGFGNGWEPYPSSLRIVNWVKWSLTGIKLEEAWLHSLAVQVRYLSDNLETHLLGNHLFANAKALIFAGLFFTGKEADDWYNAGLKIIDHELTEQVMDDGGNFELSTMYHAIFLEDLLDLVNLYNEYDRAIPNKIESIIRKMLYWLIAMCHPDEEVSFFNDSAFGVTPSVAQIVKYAERLGFNKIELSNGLIDFPDTGYSRVQIGDMVALVDRAAIGPDYLPAHAHADTLSFELSLFAQRVIVNSGTSVYGAGSERLRQRGTAVHSTVVVDNENSSEVWGGFRVARRSRVKNRFSTIQQTPFNIQLSACHDGYKRLSGSPVHLRSWSFRQDSLVIDDVIEGSGKHDIDVIYPLHPNVLITEISEQSLNLLVNERCVIFEFEGTGVLNVVASTYHPEFGLSIENKKLVYHVQNNLPIKVKTLIYWKGNV